MLIGAPLTRRGALLPLTLVLCIVSLVDATITTPGHTPPLSQPSTRRLSKPAAAPQLQPASSRAGLRRDDVQRLRGGAIVDSSKLAGKIFFNEKTRTFSLYSKSSLYAFRADEAGDLQHVYWGKTLPQEDDLRFLSFSNVAICFDPGPMNTYEDGDTGSSATPAVHNPTLPDGFTMPVRQLSFSDAQVPLHGTTDAELERSLPLVGRNTKLLEFADLGTGDYRPPTFKVQYDDGGSISPATYKGHEIIKGKLPMKVAVGRSLWETGNVTLLPQLRGDADTCSTLRVFMEDSLTGLEFELIYTVYKDSNAITRRNIIKNPAKRRNAPKTTGTGVDHINTVKLHRLMSSTVDFHTQGDWNLISLSGSWANERHLRFHSLSQGRFVFESLRGASSHQQNPFCALTNSPEEIVEREGDVWAFSLVYSGNFKFEADVSETGRARVNAGINPSAFSWHLPPGDSFESPECVMVYSSTGLEGMTHSFHDLYRQHLIPEQWKDTVPSVLLNTWEAMYFDVNHEKVVNLAKAASTCGVEMIVLDDGWFGARQDATSSLGDWYEDRNKFPEGLSGLVKDVNSLGLKFGIWVEPEMINVNSQLYRALPTWTLNQHGRKSRCEGRNQLVLDFTLEGVVSYVISKLGALLSASNIEYLKWDMNRHLTEVYGNSIAENKQGEVFHRYMLGVYKVLSFLNDKFPNVRIETCSGGGGRFDPGMLHFSPQVWASDNTDVFSRMAIQHGTSLVYPLQSIGSHMTAVPNHQTHRHSSLKTRFLVALFGTFGLELDVRTLEHDEIIELGKYIKMYKLLAPVIISGDFYRLWSPQLKYSEQHATAWMCVAKSSPKHNPDTVIGVVAVFLVKMEPGRHLPRLRLRGLDASTFYILEELFPNRSSRDVNTGAIVLGVGNPQWNTGKKHLKITGATLMEAGIPIRLSFDGDSAAFVLRKAA